MNAKNKWMLLAAVACCGLITLFLCIWLNDQYRMEHYRLKKTAGDDVNRTVEKVTEKMMYKLLQQPLGALDKPDSANRTINIVVTDTVIHAQRNNLKAQHGRITIRNKEASEQMIMLTDNHPEFPRKDVNVLFSKGLKVFVNQLAEVNTGGNVTRVTGQKLDTVLFTKQLRADWSNKQLQYQLSFNAGKSAGITELQVPKVFDQPVRVSLVNLESKAFQSILPQLSFAIFLLIVLGASFAWMYRSWKKQVELNELRMDFMHNMTHELKTPVSTVKVALEALNHYNRKTDPKVVEEYLQLMEHEVNRLDTLVHNVMSNSWAEAKELLLQKKPVNVNNELQTFVERLRSKVGWQRATVHLKIPENAINFAWDPFHIEGVLTNLADNALKYAGPEVELTIALRPHHDYVIIIFKDNGPGIPESFRNEIFNPFVRVPQGDVHNVKGYGLGLSYCKKVMEAHRGSIKYVTGENPGACFILKFYRH